MGIFDNPNAYLGGLLGNAYIDPMTGGFSAAAQALLPMMGATRLPSGGLGAALAAAGAGYGAGVRAARQQNLQNIPIAQGIETNRLNLAPYEDMQGGVGPAQMKSPLGAPSPLQQSQDLTAQTGASPGLLMQQPGDYPPGLPGTAPTVGRPSGVSWAASPQGQQAIREEATAQPGDGAMPGVPFAASQGQSAPQSAPNILDPQTIARQIAFLRQSPAGMAMIPKYLEVLDSMNKLGTGFDANGNQIRLGGANSADYQKNLFEALGKNLQMRNQDGSIQSVPGVIPDAAAKAAAVKGAEANAQNASDYFYKPKIAGDTAWATLDPEAQKARDAATAQWLKPLEQRQGSETLAPFAIPGAPQQRPLGNLGSVNLSSPQTQPPAAPTGKPGVVSYNSPETGKNATNLAEETQFSREAADGAYTQRALYGKMLTALQGANLGHGADSLTNVKAFLTQWGGSLGIDATKSITQDQIFDKMSTQVAGQATKQLDQTANAALETMRKAYPNRAMTPQALREMVGQLSGLQDYIIAKDSARQHYISQTGSADGFVQSAWVRNNTPDKFIEAGIKAAKPGPGPENEAKATQLRNNFRMLSAPEQAKQEDNFMSQLRALGYE